MNDRELNFWFSLVFIFVLFACSCFGNMVQYSRVRELTLEKHELQDRVWELEHSFTINIGKNK